MRTPFIYCLLGLLSYGVWAYADGEWNPTNPAEPYVSYAVIASASPSAAGTVSGGGMYLYGQTASIAATPTDNFAFDYWTLNNHFYSDSPSFSYVVGDSVARFVAHFLPKHPVTIIASPTEGGTVSEGGKYVQGTPVSISTVPNTNYTFRYWTLNGAFYSAQLSFTYIVGDSAAVFVALFDEPEPEPYDPSSPEEPERKYRLDLRCEPEGAAALSGDGSYFSGNVASVSATYSSSDYVFVSWTNNDVLCSSDAAFTYTMPDSAVTLVAHFQPKWLVTTSAQPSYAGSTSGDGHYLEGTSITISTQAAEGFTFLSWTLNGTSYSTQPSFTYVVGDSVAAFVAQYKQDDPKPYDPSSPDEPDAMTPIQAIAPDGYYFVSWNDGVKDNPRLVPLGTESNYSPIFEQINFPISDTVEICQGEVYRFGDRRLSIGGVYRDTLQSQQGTDSVVTFCLVIHPSYHFFADTTIYDDETYIFENQVLTTPGTYTVEYISVYGCDSVFVITLKHKPHTFIVTFYDEDGNTILDSREWRYLTIPACQEPTKPADEEYTYSFDKWVPDIVAVTANATYFATYKATPHIPLSISHEMDGCKATKEIKNGVLYIIQNGKTYNAQGLEIK